MELVKDASTFRNPIIDADVPDPDAIRVGDRFYLIASSFHRAPGLPVFASDDLVNWERIGFALAGNEPTDWFALPRHGGGVWAPSIRHHGGRFVICYPDPDQGIFVVTAKDAAGPWSAPRLLLPGLGLIDPCPLWDDDGRAYLVHGWARSRSGRKNVLTVVPVDADLTATTGAAVDVIDGDLLDGFTTLEGPKFYTRDGAYWIFAPAGGVATGWQTVFRADSPFGPYEHRIALAQGDTPVNGPHQGAWVEDGAGGDWFLHFQDRGVYGRVLHLQPMAWGDDGWPVMGEAARGNRIGTGRAQPVIEHPLPLNGRGGPQRSRTLARSDDFFGGAPGLNWQWEADVDPAAVADGDGPGLRLRGSADGGNLRTMPRVLSQPLPGTACTVTVDVALEAGEAGARAGLAVLGYDYVWAGVRRSTDQGDDAAFEGVVAVRLRDDQSEHEIATVPLSEPRVRARFDIDEDAGVRVALRGIDAGVDAGADTAPVERPRASIAPDFSAVEGHWVGAGLSLFAAGTRGAAESIARFTAFTVDVREHGA